MTRPTLLAHLLALSAMAVTLTAAHAPANAAQPANTAAERVAVERVCAAAAARAERSHRIPAQLLSAVSLAESARWDAEKQEKYAWPWTVTWNGQGRYFNSKAAAVAAVRDLTARGIRNIDVGCMQVNLHYHPEAFSDLETAFDPEANADYAGRFLSTLWKTSKSWTLAVSRYHSSDPARGLAYRRKVFLNWQQERRRFYREAYEARIAARARR